MSDERFQSRLSKAEYTLDLLIKFTRSDLMKAVAEVVIAEDEQQAAAAARIEVEENVEICLRRWKEWLRSQTLRRNEECC